MKHTYAAIFTEGKNDVCHISIPNLDYETYVEYSSQAELRKKTEQELGFALWLYESEGKLFPNPSTISDKSLPSDGYIGFISCDYDKFKQSISVEDISLE